MVRHGIIWLCVPALAVLLASCGLEGDLFGPVLDRGHVIVPEPNDTLLVGQATGYDGGIVRLYTSGTFGPDADATIGAEGAFSQTLPGTFGAVGAVLWAESGESVAMGVVPEILPAETIFHTSRIVSIWDEHPVLADLNGTTTLATMVLFAAAQRFELGLDALRAETIRAALDSVLKAVATPDSAVGRFDQMLTTIEEASGGGGIPRYRAGALEGVESFLSQEWLSAAVVDYDGDGVVDTETLGFDAALAEAAAELPLDICFDEEAIVVVFHVDLRAGRLDGNCAVVDPYKHTSASPNKSVFFTGGIHEDTPVCSADRQTHCITEDEIDAANVWLGDWVPNVVPMFDDGSNGDTVANDGIWTLVVTLPTIDVATSPDRAGVRLGYKYTFGKAGGEWTDSEEWPGNRRLLEITDLTGDRVVTRYDIFGDETANKDFVNGLSPAQGGCGMVTWEVDRVEGCAGEPQENRVDTDADCTPDAWDLPGPVAPLTVDCP